MSKALTPLENEIIFYTTPDGAVHMEVFFLDETFWLSQKTNGRAVHGRGANSQLLKFRTYPASAVYAPVAEMASSKYL
jgi:hypothetical protein